MINGNRTKSDRGRSPRDLYLTPPELAVAALDKINRHFNYVLDAGCGTGNWGKGIGRVSNYCVGVDLQPHISEENESFYDEIKTGNFLDYHVMAKFDLICGNPPFSLAEEFIRHSFELLKDDGCVYFLLRLSFLEGIARCRGLFKEFPLKKVYVCSRRPSFFSINGKHTTDTLAYAVFLWQKGYYDVCPDLDWLDWEYNA